MDYTVDIENGGGKQSGVILQGTIGQLGTDGVTSATRAAGGLTVACGSDDGVLPHGTCPISFTAQASNSTGGFGTLSAGAATLYLSVLGPDGSQLAFTQVAITLQ